MAGRCGRGSGARTDLAAAILGQGRRVVNVEYVSANRPAAALFGNPRGEFGELLAYCFDFAGLMSRWRILHSTMGGRGQVRCIGALCLSADI